MSGDETVRAPESNWTVGTYAAHNEALREAVGPDKAALGLAREIQTYKDEKANELREQINSERGLYATKADVASAVEKVEATIKPLVEYVSTQQGRSAGISLSAGAFVAGLAALGTVLGLVVLIANGAL